MHMIKNISYIYTLLADKGNKISNHNAALRLMVEKLKSDKVQKTIYETLSFDINSQPKFVTLSIYISSSNA